MMDYYYLWTVVAAIACSPVALAVAAKVAEAFQTAYWRWTYRGIPGPTPGLLDGNLREILRAGGIIYALQNWAKQYGPIFKMFMMGQIYIIVADPAAARTALGKISNRSALMPPVFKLAHGKAKLFQKDSVLTARGSLWRALRNAWQPTFNPASLAAYMQPMQAGAEDLCGALTALQAGSAGKAATASKTDTGLTGDYVDMSKMFDGMTLDIVGQCAYGLKFDALSGNEAVKGTGSLGSAITVAAKDMRSTGVATTWWGFAYSFFPVLTPLFTQLARLYPGPAFARQTQGLNGMIRHSEALVKASRQAGQTTVEPQASKMNTGCFLARLIAAQEKLDKDASSDPNDKLSELALAAQAATFIVAGMDTIASALSFCVALIAQHPEVEAKLLKEIEAQSSNKPVTPEDLSKFPYLEAVINEVLRLYPPAHTIARDLPTSVKSIQLAGHTLHSDVSVMIPQYTLHRDPTAWGPRAAEFVPGRWLPKDHPDAVSEPLHMDSYMPFGAGARMCPGFKFALQELRIVLVRLYQNFTLELAPGQLPLQLTIGTNMFVKGGLILKPIPRANTMIRAYHTAELA